MSFTSVPSKSIRLNRSELFVPGSKVDLFKKAASSNADIICLDLEDAVAPQDKEQAKKNVIQALKEVDFGKKTISIRINGLDTHYCYRDVIDVTKISNEGKVIFGSTVYLQNLDTNENIDYKLVGKDEADLKKKLIFFQSPIGKGLIGKRKNDLVEITTPSGIKNFEIIDVKYI